MKRLALRLAFLAVLGLCAGFYTGCGKDSGTGPGARDTLYISTHDTLHTYDTVKIFCIDTTGYTITPTATAGGTIFPSVPVRVDTGNLQIFIVKPNVFYILDSITADGVRLQASVSPLGYLAFVLNVSKDMTIKAWFSLRQVHYGMKLIPAGTFLMGVDSTFQTSGTVNWIGDTIHQVTLSAFYMDTTEVTQAEYRGLMGVNPSYFRDSADWASRPVENLTWYDAVLYCNARSKSEGRDTVYSYSYVDGAPGYGCRGLLDLAVDFSKNGYRLPTEAEWEYACRGGTTTIYWWGNDTSGMGARAWTGYNSGSTHTVAATLANAYGLYDMTGNVCEWCNDWYGSYLSGAVTNPTGAAGSVYRVLRGGSWVNDEGSLRLAYRRGNYPNNNDPRFPFYNYGFRCVRR